MSTHRNEEGEFPPSTPTPRTDRHLSENLHSGGRSRPTVYAFARKLERELAEAKAEIERLKALESLTRTLKKGYEVFPLSVPSGAGGTVLLSLKDIESSNFSKSVDEIHTSSGQRIVITIQKVDGKTPHETRQTLEAENAELRKDKERLENILSIPLADGTRLHVGECFTIEDCYPFFSDGLENYNAKLMWDDEVKVIWYRIYPVSDRVRGIACDQDISHIEDSEVLKRIVRRPAIDAARGTTNPGEISTSPVVRESEASDE